MKKIIHILIVGILLVSCAAAIGIGANLTIVNEEYNNSKQTYTYAISNQVQQTNFPCLEDPYLGQDPPGMTPEIFAPGIVSNQLSVHSSTIFSPDGNEVYWTVMNEMDRIKIIFMKYEGGLWTQSQEVPFSSLSDDANPFFSSCGGSLYFKSTREGSNSIWVTNREGNGWSNPVNLGAPFSSYGLAWQASITREGTIYFSKQTNGFGTHDIYKAEYVNGSYILAEKLGSEINSNIDDWQVFIDPDEEYVIFGRYQLPDLFHKNGLYISYQRQDGRWSEPVNMGTAINGDHGAYFPYVSPDKKYFFFVSDMDNLNWHYNVYWVDAKIIEDLEDGNKQPNPPTRPSGPTSIEPGVSCSYSSSTTDADGDKVYYLFDWGDGTNSDWIGPYDSGETVGANHSWESKGRYQVRVKAKDEHGVQSEWSDPLVVSMPKNRALEYVQTHMLFDLFKGRFPIFNFLINSLEEKI